MPPSKVKTAKTPEEQEASRERFRQRQLYSVEKLKASHLLEQERYNHFSGLQPSELSPIGRRAQKLILQQWETEIKIAELIAEVRIAQNECPLCEDYITGLTYGEGRWDTCECVSSL